MLKALCCSSCNTWSYTYLAVAFTGKTPFRFGRSSPAHPSVTGLPCCLLAAPVRRSSPAQCGELGDTLISAVGALPDSRDESWAATVVLRSVW